MTKSDYNNCSICNHMTRVYSNYGALLCTSCRHKATNLKKLNPHFLNEDLLTELRKVVPIVHNFVDENV